MTYILVTIDPTGQRPTLRTETEYAKDILTTLDMNKVMHGYARTSQLQDRLRMGDLRIATEHAIYHISSTDTPGNEVKGSSKLEVGKNYVTARGTRVEIVHQDGCTGRYHSSCGNEFLDNGRYFDPDNNGGSHNNLVVEAVTRAVEPSVFAPYPNAETRDAVLAFENDSDTYRLMRAAVEHDKTTFRKRLRAHWDRTGGKLAWPNKTFSNRLETKKSVDVGFLLDHFVSIHFPNAGADMPTTQPINKQTAEVILAFENDRTFLDGLKNSARDTRTIERLANQVIAMRGGTTTWGPGYKNADYTAIQRYLFAEHFVKLYSTDKPTSTPTTKEKAPMNLALNQITYLNGADVSKLSDDTLIEQIGLAETELAKMDKIVNKPKKLQAKMDKLTADIAVLVKFIDDREAK